MKKLIFTLILLLIANLSFSQVNITQGLIAYFPLDGNANDLSNFHLNGNTYNTSLTDGRVDDALFFNGYNSEIISSPNNRGITNTITVCAWVRTSNTNPVPYSFIVAKYDWRIDKGFHLAIKNNKIMFAGRNLSNNYIRIDSQSEVTDGKWHFALGEIQGNTWKLWLDGVYQGVAYGTAYTPLLTSNEPLTIGYYNLGDNGNHLYFDGTIDEVRIYNRLLTQSEIDYLNLGISSLNNYSNRLFKVYPNPTNSFITSENTSNKNINKIQLLDINGRVVLEITNNIKQLDVSSIKKGVYLLQISDNKEVIYNEKIIIK